MGVKARIGGRRSYPRCSGELPRLAYAYYAHSTSTRELYLTVKIASHKSLSEISTQTFQLPQSLAQKLKQISNQCYNGLGFQILRGIDPSQYTPEQNVIIYAGVSSHIGSQRGFTDGYMQKAVVCKISPGGKSNRARILTSSLSSSRCECQPQRLRPKSRCCPWIH